MYIIECGEIKNEWIIQLIRVVYVCSMHYVCTEHVYENRISILLLNLRNDKIIIIIILIKDEQYNASIVNNSKSIFIVLAG